MVVDSPAGVSDFDIHPLIVAGKGIDCMEEADHCLYMCLLLMVSNIPYTMSTISFADVLQYHL